MTAATIARNQVIVGDALDELRHLPGGWIDQVVTSPPYFRLRDYQVKGQMGSESSIDEWVTRLLPIVDEVQRVLVPTGTFWLNVGDTFAQRPADGATRKSLLLGPERLALAMTHRGWVLRSKVIWHKPNPTPSSVTDRLTASWEYVYVFAKQPHYFFDLDPIRSPLKSSRRPHNRAKARHDGWKGSHAASTSGLALMDRRGLAGHPLGKNPGDVWTIATHRGYDGHHATFPESLVTRMIMAGCPERRCRTCRSPHRRPLRRQGHTATRLPLQPTCACDAPSEPGLVCDPFVGSGTTAVVAERLHRDWLGIELSPKFAASAARRVGHGPP